MRKRQRLIFYAELFKKLRCLPHNGPIAVAAHDDADLCHKSLLGADGVKSGKMEKLSFAYGCGGAFCRRAARVSLYQAAPSCPCNVFLLQPVLAFADFEHGFGRGWAVFETVGVTPSDFDDGFAVAHTRPALQQQVHTALRDAAAVASVRAFQQGGSGRKPAAFIVFECLIVEVLCGFDGMCGCAAALRY